MERMPSTVRDIRFEVEIINEPVAVMNKAGASIAESAAWDGADKRVCIDPAALGLKSLALKFALKSQVASWRNGDLKL